VQDCSEAGVKLKIYPNYNLFSMKMFFFLRFSFVQMVIVKLKTEAQTKNRKPQRKVTKLKPKLYLLLV